MYRISAMDSWVDHKSDPDMTVLESVFPAVVKGFRSVKVREHLLTWILKYITKLNNSKSKEQLIKGTVDCMCDKNKKVRDLATKVYRYHWCI